MTPGQKRTELHEQASSAAKMADKFLGASNGGREHASIRSAKNNLRLSLAAVEHIEAINNGLEEPRTSRG